jgi:hypothetical protein
MTTPYRRASDLDPFVALEDQDIFLATDISENRSKKLLFSFLRTRLQETLQFYADNIVNNSTVPGTYVDEALDYLLEHGGGGAGVDFEPKVEMLALQPLDITRKYIILNKQPFNLTHVRLELLDGQIQINKKAISGGSGPLTPNFEVDANLKTRLYFGNVPANYGGEGNEAHTGLSEGFTEGLVFVISYLYKLVP